MRTGNHSDPSRDEASVPPEDLRKGARALVESWFDPEGGDIYLTAHDYRRVDIEKSIVAFALSATATIRSPSREGVVPEEWLPIDSAPKDREVLLWPDPFNKVSPGKWDDDRYSNRPRPYWSFSAFQRSVSRSALPTHWTELPAPPGSTTTPVSETPPADADVIAALREALEPFARAADSFPHGVHVAIDNRIGESGELYGDQHTFRSWCGGTMTFGDLRRARATLTRLEASQPASSGSEKWCQPGDVKQRQWLLLYEDPDQGRSTFTDEVEAREAFRRANDGGWNCYLFAAAPAGLGDGRLICEALGFDPTNHHNALKCPYCNPEGLTLASPVPDTPPADAGLVWAVEQWNSEVANRPLQNMHRRSLDGTWRQVIRHFGGDDVALCGPRHDDLLDDRDTAQHAALARATGGQHV